MADITKELVVREFYDQIPPAEGRKYQISATTDGKSKIEDVTDYQQEGTAWTAAWASMAINGLPPIGDITFGFYRISYPGGDVNAKTFPWVNFDDDLDPEVYPQLYALYGDSLSSGAAEGMFNLAMLADRFPLVSASNFGEVGGEAEHKLTMEEMPSHTHASSVSYLMVYGSEDAGVQKITGTRIDVGGSGDKSITVMKTGGSKSHNNMPSYFKICAHVRAG